MCPSADPMLRRSKNPVNRDGRVNGTGMRAVSSKPNRGRKYEPLNGQTMGDGTVSSEWFYGRANDTRSKVYPFFSSRAMRPSSPARCATPTTTK